MTEKGHKWYEYPVKDNDEKLHHYCGVVGIHSVSKINIPEKLYYPLFSLQHRGQETAGVSYRKGDEIVVYKDIGMVSAVLGRYLELDRSSNVGIGHVRYSTHGGNEIANAQPMHVTCNKGEIALAHNGNISNTAQLKDTLFKEGSIFQSTSDSELILHMISRSRKLTFYDALVETLRKLQGAFSIVMIHKERLYIMRDPRGFRPLFIGKKGDMTVAVSETCAFDILGVKEYRSVKPGEIICVDPEGNQHSELFDTAPDISQCIFEMIYFARPDSRVFDESVYYMRKRLGAALAEADSVEGDLVVPVPDSGNTAAMGYAEAAGLPFEFGLTRNHYAPRSFIQPTQEQRKLAVRMKLNPVRDIIEGKRIILVDDSLVRGTTSKILVELLRKTGAKEIHLRLSAPEIHCPCYFGIDIPTREELISNSKTPDEIAKYIGADSVRFLTIDQLKKCTSDEQNFCYACFNGEYPIDVSKHVDMAHHKDVAKYEDVLEYLAAKENR